MVLTSCTLSENGKGSVTTENTTEIKTEQTTETPTEKATEKITEKPTEKVTEEPTEIETETPVEDEPQISEYRLKISRTREELEAMLTLSDEDFVALEEKLQAFKDIALVSDDYEAVDAIYVEFEDMFYHIETQISIASIIYYIDMSDEEASAKYLDAYGKYGDVYNEYIEVCKAVYENSPIRDQLFEDWTEEDIEELYNYDPEMQELREKNEEILVEINELTGPQAYDRTAELYAQMVVNNNKLAVLCGYDNYYDYASVEIYGRDYTIEDIEAFGKLISKYYVENHDEIYNGWYNDFSKLSNDDYYTMIDYLYEPFDSLDRNYLEGYILSYKNNSTAQGFFHMLNNRNIVFTDAENSHPSAFQTYLTELETPFCLFGVNGQATSSVVHEMGHYYAALYNPDVFSFDIAETQSQANEMLLLEYLDGALPAPVYKAVRGYSIYNFVVMSIVCVIIDEFERRVYTAEGVENFTSAEFDALMKEVCENYGGIAFVNENITPINQYWRSVATNSPVYYISYATSMTSSLNIFAEAETQRAAGRAIYKKLVEEIDENDGFLEAVEKAGLVSPFTEEAFEKIIALIK